jgi:hypothetical protein
MNSRVLVLITMAIIVVIAGGCSTNTRAITPVELFSAEAMAEARGTPKSNGARSSSESASESDEFLASLGVSSAGAEELPPARKGGIYYQAVETRSHGWLFHRNITLLAAFLYNEADGSVEHLGSVDAAGASVYEGGAMAAGLVGAAALIRPSRTNVVQEGGGANANAGAGSKIGDINVENVNDVKTNASANLIHH